MEFLKINGGSLIKLEFDGWHKNIKFLNIKRDLNTKKFYIKPRFFCKATISTSQQSFQGPPEQVKNLIWKNCRAYFEVSSDDPSLNTKDYEKIEKIIKTLDINKIKNIVKHYPMEENLLCLDYLERTGYEPFNYLRSVWNYEIDFKKGYAKKDKKFENELIKEFKFSLKEYVDYVVDKEEEWNKKVKELNMDNHLAVKVQKRANQYFESNKKEKRLYLEKMLKYNSKITRWKEIIKDLNRKIVKKEALEEKDKRIKSQIEHFSSMKNKKNNS